MSKFYAKLNASLQEFIRVQNIFFTATAPEDGRINLSPKGMNTFRCIDETTVAYLDLTGSGNETAAHLNENGRITVMFCSFTEEPLILRLYGTGRVILPRHVDWDAFHAHFEPIAGERQIVVIDIQAVQTSCGYAVPVYDLKAERQKLVQWAERKGEAGLQKYWYEKNRQSIDGLPTGLLE